jgi:hypothetical protein
MEHNLLTRPTPKHDAPMLFEDLLPSLFLNRSTVSPSSIDHLESIIDRGNASSTQPIPTLQIEQVTPNTSCKEDILPDQQYLLSSELTEIRIMFIDRITVNTVDILERSYPAMIDNTTIVPDDDIRNATYTVLTKERDLSEWLTKTDKDIHNKY